VIWFAIVFMGQAEAREPSSQSELEKQRLRAGALFEEGLDPTEVAGRLWVSVSSANGFARISLGQKGGSETRRDRGVRGREWVLPEAVGPLHLGASRMHPRHHRSHELEAGVGDLGSPRRPSQQAGVCVHHRPYTLAPGRVPAALRARAQPRGADVGEPPAGARKEVPEMRAKDTSCAWASTPGVPPVRPAVRQRPTPAPVRALL
jgi:hypothetical protein